MIHVAVDSTGDYLCAVVAEDGCARRRLNRRLERAHGRLLPLLLRQLLARDRLSLAQVSFFGVGIGPGSFTGMRIGIAALQALAWGLRKPLVGFSSLDILAWQATASGDICAVRQAQRGQVYAAWYRRTPQTLQRQGEYQLAPAAAIGAALRPPLIMCGDAAPRCLALCPSPAGITVCPAEYWPPRPQTLAVLSFLRFRQPGAHRPEQVRPLYLYPDACTVNPPAG